MFKVFAHAGHDHSKDAHPETTQHTGTAANEGMLVYSTPLIAGGLLVVVALVAIVVMYLSGNETKATKSAKKTSHKK